MQIRELSCKTLQIPMKTIKPQKTRNNSQKKRETNQKKMQPYVVVSTNWKKPGLTTLFKLLLGSFVGQGVWPGATSATRPSLSKVTAGASRAAESRLLVRS
jgi:hypothetical protein